MHYADHSFFLHNFKLFLNLRKQNTPKMAILTNFWGYFLNAILCNALIIYLLAFFKETLNGLTQQ